MDLEKLKKQWQDYNEEFDREDYMDIEKHINMAMKVGGLISKIENLQLQLQEHQPLEKPCYDCGKNEANPGLEVCGECYHKRITGE